MIVCRHDHWFLIPFILIAASTAGIDSVVIRRLFDISADRICPRTAIKTSATSSFSGRRSTRQVSQGGVAGGVLIA
jgi:hypothetical protein